MKGETVKSIRQEHLAGQAADCIKIVRPDKSSREVCVDPSTGLLNRQKQGFIDAEFAPIDSKFFPRSISLTKDGKRIVEIHVTQFEIGKELSPNRFAAPAGAVSQPGCMNPIRGPKVKDVAPVYPQIAKIAHVQGIVATDALIDTTGSFKNLRVVRTASPLLNQATLDALKTWQYEPATCGGNPVQSEMLLETSFELR